MEDDKVWSCILQYGIISGVPHNFPLCLLLSFMEAETFVQAYLGDIEDSFPDHLSKAKISIKHVT